MFAKKVNQLIVAAMLSLSSIMFMCSFLIFDKNKETLQHQIQDGDDLNLGNTQKICEKTAKDLKLIIRSDRIGNIYIERKEIGNLDMSSGRSSTNMLFAKVSTLIMACHAYELDTMCVGSMCGDNQFSAKLKKTGG